MRNFFAWNQVDNTQRYHQTLLMATKKGDMDAVDDLLSNATNYCSGGTIEGYWKLKSIYIDQLFDLKRQANMNLPMLKDIASFEAQLEEKADDILDPMPALERVDDDDSSEEISDFVEIDQPLPSPPLPTTVVKEDDESDDNSTVVLDNSFLPISMVEGLTNQEFYDSTTKLLLSRHLTANHLGLEGSDHLNNTWKVISKKDGGYCWTCPIQSEDDSSSDSEGDSSSEYEIDSSSASSDSSSDSSSESSSDESSSESSSELDKKNDKPQKVFNDVCVSPIEMVAPQAIKLNSQEWIEYVTQNCSDLDSFLKVIDNGFVGSWLLSKHHPDKDNFVSKFLDKAIVLDFVEVLMCLNFNWSSSTMILAIESGSFRTATYLTRFDGEKVSETISQLIKKKKINLVEKYLSNVYLGDLETDVYEELITYPSLHQVLVDQKFDTVEHDIIEYLNNEGEFKKLKDFVNRNF